MLAVCLPQGRAVFWDSCVRTCVCVDVNACVYMILPSRKVLTVAKRNRKWKPELMATNTKARKAAEKQQGKWKSEVKRHWKLEREKRERESAFYFRQCLEVFWRESMWVSVCVCVSGMVCVYTDITACYCSVHVPDGGSCFSVSVSATHSELTHSLCLYCLLLTSSILFTHSHFISNFATTC